MSKYDKIYNRQWQRQMKEINDCLTLPNMAIAQAMETSQAISKAGIVNIQEQIAQMKDVSGISLTNAMNEFTNQIHKNLNQSMQHITTSSVGLEWASRYLELISNLKPQFDFATYTQNILDHYEEKFGIFDNSNKSRAESLFEILEILDSYTDINEKEDCSHKTTEEKSYDDSRATQSQAKSGDQILSETEINKTCRTIETIIFYPETAVKKISKEKRFYEDHPIVCGIIIGIVSGIIVGLILAKIITEPSQNTMVVTKNINSTVKESLDEPQKDKIKLPPNTSIIIVDESIPRYYEIEYIDPTTGEKKCGYVAKQCVMQIENGHENRAGE